ncbi:histidinol-phosphate aminotransferase [mine drainage metagenome]|uniref:Histidinol-phosphate aminotransferase n=1 Tax=mine drainage metagenome TaxID=410659 RepID=A0A1J5P7N4_9ZZZZ
MSEWPKWLPIRDDLRGLSAYGAPQLDVINRLNTNENPYSLSDELVADITESVRAIAKDLNRYPDRDAIALRAALAAYVSRSSGVEFTSVRTWAANGSNEIIQQIFQAFGGRGHTALGFTPSYSMHPLIARTTGTNWIDGQRDPDFTLSGESAVAQIKDVQPQLVFITSPNNPTGTAVSLDTQRAILEAAREIGALVVIDEAYAEFARTGTRSALTLLNEFPNALVTRTMSKAFAMAGVTPADIDVAEVYDCFTYIVMCQLEDLGFCKKGEGGDYVSSGITRLGGRRPNNTSGGHLCEGYTHGMNMVIENVRQLRHDIDDSCPMGPDGKRQHTYDYREGGCRQVKDIEVTANLGWASPGTTSGMVMRRG